MELPRGAMDDCRRGEDPSAVFFGDRDRGGGRSVRLLRSIWCAVVRSGIEPTVKYMSAHLMYSMRRLREPPNPRGHVLSCISIDSDAVTVPPRLGGDFSGDENMPEIGSKPCSS
jgi:hypothetical protein